MTKWQPIETAPKDAHEILVYEDGEMSITYWNKYAECWDYDVVCDSKPTHWMPLPEPPEEV